MQINKTCPHEESARIDITGTQQWGMLSRGLDSPLEFSRPQVVAIPWVGYSSPAED